MSAYKYTIIVPVYNSANTLPELVERIENVMRPYTPYELLMIDDLSHDNSWEILKKVKGDRNHIRLLRFTKNFGQASALICGFREAKAPITISIDDDLQFQPEDIPKLIEHYNPEQHYAVFGVPSKWKRGMNGFMSLGVDRIIQRMAFKNHDAALKFSSFRIASRKTYLGDNYSEKGMRSVHVFFNMVSPRLIDFVDVEYKPRKKGKSNYNLMKRIRLVLEIIVTLTELPMVWFLYLFVLFALVTVLAGMWTLFNIHVWNHYLSSVLLGGLGLTISLGFVFLFAYLRRVYLTFQGADVYAIWQEA